VTDLTDSSPAPVSGAKGPCSVSARRGGLLAAGALVLTGLFFAWQSLYLDFGDFGLPGPGFFPFALGVVLVAFAAAIIIETARADKQEEAVELGHRDVMIAFAAMLAVPLLFEPLGAYLTLGLFCVVLLVLIGKVHPLRAVIGAAIGMAGVWYFFKVLLGLQLPNGPF
jgi:Tripartite tricarboxylate transporter TctB family